MNKEAVADCMQPNTMIQSVYFHSEKETDMRKALQYLRQHPTYSAIFSRSRLLQVFVVDLQKNELSAIYQWWCCHAAFHRPAGASAAIDYGGWQKGNEHLLYVWREHVHTEGMLCAAYPCPGSQAYSRRLPDGNAGSIRVRPDDLYEAVGSGHDFCCHCFFRCLCPKAICSCLL